MTIDVPRIIRLVLYVKARFKVLFGGRGSAKSWSIADYLIHKAISGAFRILCTREMQNSIRDSVHRLLVDRINYHGLGKYFVIQKDSITSVYGSEFLFKGLHHNINEIKSTEGIDVCWVEEADKVSRESWETLVPTIRKPDSEIIISFNPDDEKSATYTMFIEKDGKPIDRPDIVKAFVNYWDNPWFPDVLRSEMEYCKVNDPEKYDHVWAGHPKKYGQSVIFKNKLRIENFEPANTDTTQFYFGADWGFGTDPSCLVRCFIRDRKLYIDQEFYGYGIEIDDLPACFEKVERSKKWVIRGDSSRPDTISYMCRQGFNVEGAEKGAGSVEDGIEFIKNFEAIVIHPSCVGSIGDFSNYRWKVDKTTGDVLPIPVDKSNHATDAVRYALEPYMKSNEVKVWSL